MTSRAKLNLTEKLIRNMTVDEKHRVAITPNMRTSFEISEQMPPKFSTFDCAYMMKFRVAWECHSVVRGDDASIWNAKERMARHIKNEMYRDVVNELYRIAEELAALPAETKAFDSIYDLIKELS